MTYLGRATDIKFETKLNGTHTLTFQMPDKYFDNEKGDYVHNEFVDNLFNERKIKLKFMNQWYEFYIKTVSDTKQFKSYMKKYTCSDAFIDELSRNGYGITFDTELYNNVEEIGTFSRVILEDSIWDYAPEHNWGDFTEYLEEKLFKIPVGGDLFPTLVGHKLAYEIESPQNNEQIINVFTKKKRNLEMGDDLAAAIDGKGGYFWDAYDGSMPLMNETISNIPNDGYIYVPYSQLEFCYKTTSTESGSSHVLTATEEVCYYGNKSYAIAPNTVDPTALIQFIAIPRDAEIEVDEAGLIINKNYTYVMTVEEWNKHIGSQYYSKFLPESRKDSKEFKLVSDLPNGFDYAAAAVGNLAAYYEGYLDKIGDLEVIYGKKISISDRTEVNVTDEIDQYVTVYNQKYDDENLIDLYVNPDGLWKDVSEGEDSIQYRVCSKTETRQVVPQLARNYLQNGTKIKTTDGWEPQRIYNENGSYKYSTTLLRVNTWENNSSEDYMTNPQDTFLQVSPPATPLDWVLEEPEEEGSNYTYSYENQIPKNSDDDYSVYNTLINFGIVGQEKELTLDKIYCLGLRIGLEVPPVPNGAIYNIDTDGMKKEMLSLFNIRIGRGSVLTDGDYEIECSDNVNNSKGVILPLSKIIDINSGEKITIQERTSDSRKVVSKELYVYEGYVFIKFNQNITNPYFAISQDTNFDNRGTCTIDDEIYNIIYNYYPNYYIFNAYLFEAYTKGRDQFEGDDIQYRYSGRDLFDTVLTRNDINCQLSDVIDKDSIHNQIIFEEDVMPGDTYGYQHYFIQQVAALESDYETGQRNNHIAIADTFAQKELLNNYADFINFKNANISTHDLPYSAAQFTNDDLEISTKYIDLNKCKYYNEHSSFSEPDCLYDGEHICLYQKYGYCPYLFQTEKHCRKIRTLKGEKSNRFNLTQELSKVFEIYPIYWTEHYDNGKIKTDLVTDIDEEGNSISYNRMRKKLFYIKEKGMENKLGFRYEKNLSSISQDIKSDQIVTKLYVSDVDSDLSKTGLCSIKTAEDNPSKDSFIINFNYYTTKGILDKLSTDADLYGINSNDMGYLKQLGYFNSEYDKISNAIINLEAASFNELEANITANITGIETAQKQLHKIKKDIDRYKSQPKDSSAAAIAVAKEANTENQSYQNQITKYNEQLNILNNLIYETFFDQVTNEYLKIETEDILVPPASCSREDVMDFFAVKDIKWMEESSWFKQHTYSFGMLGQYNREYLQISEWKKQQSSLLKEINKLALKFFRKYEPYLKEGTWSDSNYISDNAYYFGACEVAAEGAIPKVSYNISVVDLYALPEYEDYKFNIADTTYIEDIGMFGINKITGLPNKLKVIISSISYDLDEPSKNTISVQNFTTQFADLFQQVTASVQSLSFNENIYKRASNFTANQNIDQDSLQGTLDTNEMQLIKTDETNIEIDKEGQSGSDINNHSNKYKLNGQGMVFSNNGGETWNIGVGPSGINADYINVGTLDAGKIRIVDNNYLYFLWDKNGISAFRDPQSTNGEVLFNDYALFNRYGLSLIEQGKIRLRAGYKFNGATPDNSAISSNYGKIGTEYYQGEDIGFYLYNDRGQAIFYSAVASDSTDKDKDSAKVYLVGEMYVTDKITASGTPIGSSYKYSKGYNITSLPGIQRGIDKSSLNTIPINGTSVLAEDNNIIYSTVSINGTKNNFESLFYIWVSDSSHLNQNKTNLFRPIFEQSFDQYDILVSSNTSEGQMIVEINGVRHLITQTINYYNIKKVSINIDELNNISYNVLRDLDTVYLLTVNNKTYIYSNTYGTLETINTINAYSSVATGYGGNISAVEYDNLFDMTTLNSDIAEQNKTLYPLVNGGYNYWRDKEYIQNSTSPSASELTSQVALYLNNTNIKDAGEIAEDEERILCVAGDSDNSSSRMIRNFLSIRKDGSLYIGGTIESADDNVSAISSVTNIPNKIKVISPLLEASRINGEDQIQIDFSRFYNAVDGKSLYDSLVVAGGTTGQHKHSLESAIAVIQAADDNISNYLPDEDARPSAQIYYDSSAGMIQTKLVDEINHAVYNLIGSDTQKIGGAIYTILYHLLTDGYYEIDHGSQAGKTKIVFSNAVLGAGGKFRLTFENSTTGNVINGGSSTSAYGLYDPGNTDSGGGN